MTSTQWVEYHVGTKRKSYNTLPTSDITAEAVTVGGFTLSQTDNSGVTTTASRSYTASGMIHIRTDGRGNTTTTVTDAAWVRTLGYNSYGEQESDSLVADNVTHLITETRDDKGRSTGYTYSKNGTVQQTVTTGYGSDGRIASAGFLHGGTAKQFSYQYLSDTHLLEKLTMPNNMSLTQSYEIQRDLLTGMAYHRGTTLVANRQYSYDTLGRPTARNTSRQGSVKNDTFGYNTPTFDADGNQMLVKTTTGTWEVAYDTENRPVNFTNAETNTVIECGYDHMGRRATKKVTVDGSITLHQCYLYRGYLQIACCDLTRSAHPCLWLITWDPTQPIATRPLAIQKDGTWYTYGWDLTKNICELYGTNGYIRTAYTYTPYGSVTESGNTWQPIQWSSEYNDTELGLVYYNYRHYNPMDGRWLGRDLLNEYYEKNLYSNQSVKWIDRLGLYPVPLSDSDFNPEWSSEERKKDERNIYGLTQIETKYILDELYISSDLIEGCPFFIFHKTLEAQKLGIKVTIYKHHKNYKDRKGRTPLEHEQMHFKIIAEEWNSFIASAELHVGWYESYKAYKLAHPNETIGSLMLEYHNNITNRNANLDRESYWS